MNTTGPHTPESPYDVVIAGGGPGGATLATFLAKAGHRCLIVDRAQFPRYHVGESLMPQAYGVLDRLGILPKLKGTNFSPKHGVRIVARDGQSVAFHYADAITDERAVTWHVERGEFDRLLLEHARENGVEVWDGTYVDTVLFRENRAVGVRVSSQPGEQIDVPAKVVVDASGRTCLIGTQLALKQDIPGLRKSALWGYFHNGKQPSGSESGETTIYLMPGGGWFWHVPLSRDMVSVGIVADPEYLFTGEGSSEHILTREVANCTPLAARLEGMECPGPVRALRQLAYMNRQTCGDGWVMIGDARVFLDPVFSSGLFLALTSAELAAGCIDAALREDDTSAARLECFEPKLWEGVEVVRRLIHAFYDPNFNFAEFIKRFPEQREALIHCLVGDVLKDLHSFTDALAQMTPPPPPLTK